MEGYVFYELEQNGLNLNNIPALVQNVKEQIMRKKDELYDKVKALQQELDAVDCKMGDIIKSVENGLVYDELISRLNNLQQRKTDLIIEIKEYESEVRIIRQQSSHLVVQEVPENYSGWRQKED